MPAGNMLAMATFSISVRNLINTLVGQAILLSESCDIFMYVVAPKYIYI